MPARFVDIKFNLMRAIELFEDMNHLDMDVTAPPSASNFYKETEVAQRLNIFLGQLIEEGVFDDCELRENESSIDEDEEAEQVGEDSEPEENIDEEDDTDGDRDGDEDEEQSTPKSEGFNYERGSTSDADDRSSLESLSDRIKRVMPSGGKLAMSVDKVQVTCKGVYYKP